MQDNKKEGRIKGRKEIEKKGRKREGRECWMPRRKEGGMKARKDVERKGMETEGREVGGREWITRKK